MSVIKYVDYEGLEHFKEQIDNKFVSKVNGKGLSTNDYTTEEKNKLNNIESGAEVNTIDSISVNNVPQTADANKNVNISVPTATSELDNDSNFQNSNQVENAINAKISSAYKAKGSILFVNLPVLSADVEGYVYNITDNFTTTSDFVEGAGNTYPAGTNVVIINTTGDTYKYDVLSGFVDLSNYVQTSDLIAITNSEIDEIFNE